jgi:UDPglucose 6-dehydrogenase
MITLEKISVVGLGYVGLCTAVSFAVKGYQVIVSSNNSSKVEMVNKGISPLYEPELENMLKKGIESEKFRAVLGSEETVLDSDAVFIAVGTPSLPDGSIDLKHIRTSAQEIGKALRRKKSYSLVVVKSTVVPGTTEKVVKPILEKSSGKSAGEDFGLCMNPEFLREGSAIHDIFHPDMIIIGEYDEKSGKSLEELYQDFYEYNIPILRMNTTSAEMVKYVINAFLATKISFINEIANICERVPGLDVLEVARAIGLDSRISPKFLSAGAGWGGSCLPKDVRALQAFSEKVGYKPKLLEAAISVNLEQVKQIVDLAKEELGNLQGKKIAILGLSFKPNTDDMREAISIRIINHLLAQGAQVYAFDPVATDNAKKVLDERVKYSATINECLENADCCILVTEWDEFKKLRPEDFIRFMKKALLIDGRRIYDHREFSKKLRLRAIGLGKLP